MFVSSAASASPTEHLTGDMKEYTQEKNLIHARNVGRVSRLSILKKHAKVHMTERGDHEVTPSSQEHAPNLSQCETYSCWICQEELSSNDSLLEHHERHMDLEDT